MIFQLEVKVEVKVVEVKVEVVVEGVEATSDVERDPVPHPGCLKRTLV